MRQDVVQKRTASALAAVATALNQVRVCVFSVVWLSHLRTFHGC